MRTSIVGRVRALHLVLAAIGVLSASTDARASSVLEIPDNGSEQMGRGGAWVARASDPLAAFYNPAGLAGQDTKVTLQANVDIQSTCFTRVKAAGDTTIEKTPAGGTFPEVCSDGKAFPNPQLAFTYKLNDRVGLGIAVLGPSAAGQQTWPETLNGAPAPQRYLLLSANTLLLTPTIGVGWEPIDRWRIGASFLWGIANLDFSNDSYAINQAGATPSSNDIKAELKVKNYFVPGFTVGTIWSPTDNLDVAGWYKWLDPITAKGDVTTSITSRGKQFVTDSAASDCGWNQAAGICGPDKATVKITVPMEAKIGVRYHQPRPGIEQMHRRDPLSQDVFDVEADLTWANNSAFDAIHIALPGNPDGSGQIPTNGALGGAIPPNADVPHQFKDVVGVRVGGDYNVIADKLAVRLGGYFETRAQDDQYANIDFAGAQRIGIAAGGTYRIHLSEADTKAIEISLGFGHTFIGTLTNNGPNGVVPLAGTDCYSGGSGAAVPGTQTCSDGSQRYRYPFPTNLGTVTNSFTAINLGLSYRF